MDTLDKITDASKHVLAAIQAYAATEHAALYVAFVPPKADASTRMTVVGLGDEPSHAVNCAWGILSATLQAFAEADEQCPCEHCKTAIKAARQCTAIMEGIKACRH